MTFPQVPSDARRLLIVNSIIRASFLLFGAALSITGSVTGSVPVWVGWAIVAGLLLPLSYWVDRGVARWGILHERADTLASVVGYWSLHRGDVEVSGYLVPDNRAAARLFAYKIRIVLSEDTGQAEVAVLEKIPE